MKLLIAHHGGGKAIAMFVCLFLPVVGTKHVLFVMPEWLLAWFLCSDEGRNPKPLAADQTRIREFELGRESGKVDCCFDCAKFWIFDMRDD